jgi:uncharacterized repeat protein (TIGR03803 family)
MRQTPMQRNKSSALLGGGCVVLSLALLLTNYASAAPTFRVVRNFKCNPGECFPYGGLALGPSGDLYGTTPGGGAANGSIFQLTPSSGDHWAYSLLYTLTIKQGSSLVSSLTLDTSGSLYGTSNNGGTYDFGTVFELSPDPATGAAWTLTVVHSFDPFANDGSGPWDKIILDKAGNLYGTTRDMGANGGGIAFKLKPGTGGEWTEAILHNFPATKDDGGQSYAELIEDGTGSLYGTTSGGGNGDGVVFKLTHTASGWKETLLHSFHGPDGSTPITGLVFDAKGNLYGTTQEGGANGEGTVFKLTPAAGGRWTHTILYDFPQFQNGAGPVSTLAFDKAGNLYGTAAGGIETCSGGCGVVYKLSPSANGKWTYSVLHRFTDKNDGAEPNGAVVFDKTGKHLYGTAIFGGTYNQGVVYEITP